MPCLRRLLRHLILNKDVDVKKLKPTPDSSKSISQFYSIDEIAKLLEMSQRSIYRLVKSGKVPSPLKLPRYRWKREVIDRWLEQGCPSCASQTETVTTLIQSAADQGHELLTAQQVLQSTAQVTSTSKTEGRRRG